MNVMIRLSTLSICAYFCVVFPVMACADNTSVKEDLSTSPTEAVEQAPTLHQKTSTAPKPQTPKHQASKHEQTNAPAIIHVNVKALKKRLRTTHAIGFFTKLAIRNDIVDLTDAIQRYRKQATLTAKINEIRASFDGLLLKIVALLDADPGLSRDLYVGREQIWLSLLEEEA